MFTEKFECFNPRERVRCKECIMTIGQKNLCFNPRERVRCKGDILPSEYIVTQNLVIVNTFRGKN